MALDFLYVVALVGTMMSNVFFALGDRMHYLSHDHLYLVFDFFPALFLFLNGVALSLTLRDKRISSRRTLSYNSKKGLVLLIVGLLFAKWWPINLFFITGFVYMMAPTITEWNNIILRVLAIFILLVSMVFLNMEIPATVEIKSLTLQGTGWQQLVAFFAYNGYYSIMPWAVFFILGLLHGRTDLRPKGILPPSSLVGLVLMVGSLVLEAYCAVVYSFDHNKTGVTLPILKLKMFLPAFLMFTAGSVVVVFNFANYLLRNIENFKLIKWIQGNSASKYNTYFFVMIIGSLLNIIFNDVLFTRTWIIILLAVGLTIASVYLTGFWKRKFTGKTPMEWLVKRIAGSTKN
jgi:hypothetical protein